MRTDHTLGKLYPCMTPVPDLEATIGESLASNTLDQQGVPMPLKPNLNEAMLPATPTHPADGGTRTRCPSPIMMPITPQRRNGSSKQPVRHIRPYRLEPRNPHKELGIILSQRWSMSSLHLKDSRTASHRGCGHLRYGNLIIIRINYLGRLGYEPTTVISRI